MINTANKIYFVILYVKAVASSLRTWLRGLVLWAAGSAGVHLDGRRGLVGHYICAASL